MTSHLSWHRDTFVVSTDPAQLDLTAIHAYLTRSTWAAGIDRATVQKSLQGSLNFGLYQHNEQIGFARLITDYATFGYLCDVWVIEEFQKQGLGRWLMECCHSHPLLATLRRIMLVTSTAPWLYEKCGYSAMTKKSNAWQIVRPDIYRRQP
ncbi:MULTISPECIES: GNAT family N-acetyltransferase [Erwinia]|uniref:Histone acetyltransferase n=2 Tax=Erwinia TaxID=551 RepID=A0A014NS86_9GAMM|nr:GNAT family N-acetyltransferase [Erwinia mallotivora]EXU76705.1 histone acetyltransferase [Erwinia mallotivora]